MGVHCGIDHITAQKFKKEAACVFPGHRQPLLSCVLNGTVAVKGSSVLDDQDLQSLFGHKTQCRQQPCFAIEDFLCLTAGKGMPDGDSFVSFKFLYSTVSSGERLLYWPREESGPQRRRRSLGLVMNGPVL